MDLYLWSSIVLSVLYFRWIIFLWKQNLWTILCFRLLFVSVITAVEAIRIRVNYLNTFCPERIRRCLLLLSLTINWLIYTLWVFPLMLYFNNIVAGFWTLFTCICHQVFVWFFICDQSIGNIKFFPFLISTIITCTSVLATIFRFYSQFTFPFAWHDWWIFFLTRMELFNLSV